MTTTTPILHRPELRRVRDGYWRVTAPSGILLGYVEEFESEGLPRYRATRLHPPLRLVAIGEFAEREEAAECLR
ncbi:hypothetical protein N1027_11025 [Herbiconiux sp. CPCC 205763]|uniref:Uncharacterized protein n=1 Tax=Herbiconiux aconitum TaxID=2970913 RepID=A0ABT2GTN7_9MICO|nr:hypothetical protein [Herbiconiux aconitum]MCS5718665.1 hypothetical protein [Herbiconiux aconitum]